MTAVKRTSGNASLSVIVYAQNEGRLLHHALKSINRAMTYAAEQGIDTEVIITADKASEPTKRYLAKFPARVLNGHYKIFELEYDDPGQSLNFALKKIDSELVALMLGKDLMSRNWLAAAARVIGQSKHPVIVHPQYIFSFGAKDRLWEIKDSDSRYFDRASMVEQDKFYPVVMMKSRLAKNHLFRPNKNDNFSSQFWLWNCDTLANDIQHRVAQRTLAADRYSADDPRLNSTAKLIRSSKYFLTDTEYEQPATLPAELGHVDKLLSIIRSAADSYYSTSPARHIKRLHPRLDLYLTSLRNESLHLLRPLKQDTQKLLPHWVLDAVSELHEADLRIFFSGYLKNNIEIFRPAAGSFTRAYWYLAGRISGGCDILLIVPYLKNGGAERELANLINEVLKIDPTKKIKILATDPESSPWADNIKGAEFIEADNDFHLLSLENQARLLATLCIQLSPRKVHIMNSMAGYIAFQNYRVALSENSKLFITIFSIDKTSEGRYTHMFTDQMQESIDCVTKVFTDNFAVVNQLVDLMAVDNTKFSVHYQPAQTGKIAQSQKTIQKRFSRKPTKILWAGRLDRQKRSDILVKVAQLFSQAEVEFHVYGAPAFHETSYLDELKKSRFIHYHGPYEGGLSSLPLEEFDIFLMTSEWEGMPNVLLEAIVNGLLIVAPGVGGVAETVENGIGGYVVESFDNIAGYVATINSAISNPEKSRAMILSAQRHVSARHNPEEYSKRIRKEKDYLD